MVRTLVIHLPGSTLPCAGMHEKKWDARDVEQCFLKAEEIALMEAPSADLCRERLREKLNGVLTDVEEEHSWGGCVCRACYSELGKRPRNMR
jgi:hypothetical protein